jgi:PAS domain S-box-containing protein
MSAHVAVLSPDGHIREVNQAWQRFSIQNSATGRPADNTGPGVDYLGLCRSCRGARADEANTAADGIEAVLRGTRESFALEYPCDSPAEVRWFSMHVTPLKSLGGGALVAHYDITARKLAELALASESRRTEMALTAAHMGVWTVDLAQMRIHLSTELNSIFGITTFDGTPAAWFRMMHPNDRPAMQAQFVEAIERRMPFAGEFRILRPDRSIRWLANVAQVECAPSGEVVAVVGTIQDITARKRSEWALTAYNHVLELIAAGAELRMILEEVVRLVEEQLPGSLCSVLIVDRATNRLRFGAGPSLPAEYNLAVDGVPIGPKAGSCGTAAFRRDTVTVTDIATDPLWDDYRDLALSHDLRSCVSVPILSSGNVPGQEKGAAIGTFALYNRTAGRFDRLTYAILSGAEQLVRQAVGSPSTGPGALEAAPLVEAARLAGVAIERQQAEQAVRESEVRFRAVLDSSPSAVYVKNLAGEYLFVNRAMAELFDAPVAEWRDKTATEHMPHELAELCERSAALAREKVGPIHGRHIVRIGGRTATLLATHFPLQRGDGETYAICGILSDVSDLVEARQEFERVWLHAPDPVCVAGFDGHFRQVNPAWSRLLGWTEHEILDRSFVDLVHPDDRGGLEDFSERIQRGEPVRAHENRLRCRDGSYRSFSWNAVPAPENQTVYCIARDVTEEKRLAEQVRQAQKMEAVGQLASGVAHDFNNLLTVIISYGEILLSDMGPAAPEREAVLLVLEAGQRAAKLTSQLLAFSRKAIVEPKTLDLNREIESSMRMLGRLIRADVRIEAKLGAIPPVKIDAGQLEQVFMNLAVNARDAMPDGGRLTITTETVTLPSPHQPTWAGSPQGTFVQVSVADTGTGMSPEVQSRIFEPFFTTKAPGRGTGLGLATVYGIVRQAGGTIAVDSELGRGTTFRILLRAESESASLAGVAALAVAPRGAETVLIAEDEAAVRNVARAILEAKGYRVLTAETGSEAAVLIARHPGPIDLLLTDVVMPELGGRSLVEVARKDRPGLKVLYMSGYTNDSVLRSDVETSKDAFIQKPFTPITLARRVREVLDLPS